MYSFNYEPVFNVESVWVFIFQIRRNPMLVEASHMIDFYEGCKFKKPFLKTLFLLIYYVRLSWMTTASS